MLLPAQYAWFEPVLIASIVVFVIDLIGASIAFGNRFLSALMSAIVFALVFGTLVYFGYGSVSMSVTTTPSTTAPAQTQIRSAKQKCWLAAAAVRLKLDLGLLNSIRRTQRTAVFQRAAYLQPVA